MNKLQNSTQRTVVSAELHELQERTPGGLTGHATSFMGLCCSLSQCLVLRLGVHHQSRMFSLEQLRHSDGEAMSSI